MRVGHNKVTRLGLGLAIPSHGNFHKLGAQTIEVGGLEAFEEATAKGGYADTSQLRRLGGTRTVRRPVPDTRLGLDCQWYGLSSR